MDHLQLELCVRSDRAQGLKDKSRKKEGAFIKSFAHAFPFCVCARRKCVPVGG